jgi:hypothetical protein
LKLSKTPSMQSTALSFFHLGSTATIRVSEAGRSPVFKNQCCSRPNRLNQALTQYMVTVFSETFLATRQLLQMLGYFGREAGSSPPSLSSALGGKRTALSSPPIPPRPPGDAVSRRKTMNYEHESIPGSGGWFVNSPSQD